MNKKLINIGFIFTLIIGIGFGIQSCDSDEEEDFLGKAKNTSIEIKKNYLSNIDRIYDDVGKLHNEGLDFVLDSLTTIKKMNIESPLSLKSSSGITDKHLDNIASIFLKRENMSFDIKSIGVPALKSNKDSQEKLEVLNNGSINSTTLKISQEALVYSVALEYKMVNAEFRSLEELDNFILDLEYELLHDDKLSSTEVDALLYMTSVAKYSTRYWADNYIKWASSLGNMEYVENNTFSSPMLKSSSESGSAWWDDVLGVAWVDAGSAGVGALVGAATGAVVGGVGAAPGAAVGAAAAGLGGSILECWNRLNPY